MSAPPSDRTIARLRALIDRIVQRVAELPDRTSPDDWPEAMLVSASELECILYDELVHSGALTAGVPPAEPKWIGHPRDVCSCGHYRETHHVWGKCHGWMAGGVAEGFAGRNCKCTGFVLQSVAEQSAGVPLRAQCDCDGPTKCDKHDIVKRLRAERPEPQEQK